MASENNNVTVRPFGVVPLLEKTGKQPNTDNIIFARTTTDGEMELTVVTNRLGPNFWATVGDTEKMFVMDGENVYWAWPTKIQDRQKGDTPIKEISPRANLASVTLVFLEDWHNGRLSSDEVCETLFAAAITRGLITPKKTPT